MSLPHTLAHLSDLHLGKSAAEEHAAERLCETLLREAVEHVVVTGDVTHRGKRAQLAIFERIFAPLIARGAVTVIPGNHDRAGEDAGAGMMSGERVRATRAPGLHLVSVDSTGPHNRSLLASHGMICEQVLHRVDAALEEAPPQALRVLLLHHHVLPLPEESWAERLATLLGWPHASELPLGLTLLDRIEGRCDLVLHGHRHVPRALKLAGRTARPLGLYNAGSSTELGAFRLFRHRRGQLLRPPCWVGPSVRRRRARPVEDILAATVGQADVGTLAAGTPGWK